MKRLIGSTESEILDFYDNNIIKLPKGMIQPTRYNPKYKKYTEIQFRKDIFLQNYEFIQELKKFFEKKGLNNLFYTINST